MLTPPGEELPEPGYSALASVRDEALALADSFRSDFNAMAGDDTGDVSITVWIGDGRDQAQILRRLIDESFTPNTGISVKLELVNNIGALLAPSILAGTSPDVALNSANMDLAFRGAVADLTQFDYFWEVAANFQNSALMAYRFRDAVYGLPEKQTFFVMFYRTDILEQMGLAIPNTWDEARKLMPLLSKANKEFGLPASITLMQMLMYQRGAAFYKEDSIATNLGTEIAIQALSEMTDFFTIYGCPYQYNAINRFRMGEMPILITDYSFYTSIAVTAPELRGKWEMALVPGTLQDDGVINRTVPVGATGAIILENSRKQAAAWEFLKWWVSADTQVEYALELESLMGIAARHTTANVEALSRLAWRARERSVLLEQWRWTEGIPPVLGGYYVQRQFDWLFRALVDDNKPVRATAYEYNEKAQAEILRKRAEFGLETDYAELSAEIKDMYWRQYTHVSGNGD